MFPLWLIFFVGAFVGVYVTMNSSRSNKPTILFLQDRVYLLQLYVAWLRVAYICKLLLC